MNSNLMVSCLISTLMLTACFDKAGPDYTTRHGIDVYVGMQNSPDIETVESWTKETLAFWQDALPTIEGECDIKSVDVTTAQFFDALHLKFQDIEAWGFSYPWNAYIEIAGMGTDKVKKIFMHELSHVIIYGCLGLDGQTESHQFFKDHGTNF